MARRWLIFIAALLILGVCAHARVVPSISALQDDAAAAMAAGDYDDAAELYASWREADPGSFVAAYNHAAALSMRGDHDDAEAALKHAIGLGFADVYQLRRDRHLDPLRTRPFLTEILAEWPRILDAQHEALLNRDKAWNRDASVERTLTAQRVEVLSAYDPVSTDAALADLHAVDAFVRTLGFEQANDGLDPWVILAMPSRRDFALWAKQTFGISRRGVGASVGGAYDHDRKRLVVSDLGATLRHEYVHVLHWRRMSRAGQADPLWIQEGVAALVETYDLDAEGNLDPKPDWRTNIVGRLARARRLMTLEQLAGMGFERFGTNRPLANYAIARAVFLWLHDLGTLPRFFDALDATRGDDPTGLLAVARTAGVEPDRLDAAFRDWVLALPVVAETGRDLSATLGIDVQVGPGDGLEVVSLTPDARRRTGLRTGAVITAIDSRPTRDMHELIRVLSTYRPAQTVTISYRRGTVHRTSEAALIPGG